VVRIISGELRGRRLRAPDGLATRPTSDRVRESLFNIVAARVPGSRFLDLFAGSGAVGLEAISRGADRAVFVEQSRRALEHIEENIAHCGVEDRTRIVAKDAQAALKVLAAAGEQFDLVYVDPPYDADLYLPVLRALGRTGLVDDDGLVVVELRSRDQLPDEAGALRHYRDVRYGDTTLAFYEPG
jgi:16S rRNA (guanine(966)-N(2))-methyltransferase RsmD